MSVLFPESPIFIVFSQVLKSPPTLGTAEPAEAEKTRPWTEHDLHSNCVLTGKLLFRQWINGEMNGSGTSPVRFRSIFLTFSPVLYSKSSAGEALQETSISARVFTLR
jgi:hypothetical protein